MEVRPVKEIIVWGEGREHLWTPTGHVDVPAEYVFLPAGDGALTRAVKTASGEQPLYVVIKRTSKKYPPRAIGLWAAVDAIQSARDRLAALRTEEHRAKLLAQKERRQKRDIEEFSVAIRTRFPGCPLEEAEIIATHACEIGSGRVGRSRTAEDPIRAAVIAHIRHEHTDYDELLDQNAESWMSNEDREEIKREVRELVRPEIDELLCLWQRSGESQRADALHLSCQRTCPKCGGIMEDDECEECGAQ
jgi:hypothetical protein